ncbi:hypothetical protein [Bradyrhizobium lablabi]|uniref:hypothetical protein n=1 Tax=Bradyrhizobium lablabi TaxID=722472 RepID=UPI0012AC09D2|nr:hypothetical protein [Bradyrhizobium lablabi]
MVVTTVVGMPLGRYFFYMGTLLLALLFLADWYMPQPAAPTARPEVDRTVIRLHSRDKWPERIVIDTSLPTIVPPPAKIAENPPERSPPPVRSLRAAFAQVTPPQAAAPAIAVKSAPKRRTRTLRAGALLTSFEAEDFRPLQMNW